MEEQVIDFRTKKQKREEFKEKVKSKCKDAIKWVSENKEIAIVIIPIAVKGITSLGKTMVKRSIQNKEEELKTMYYYDHSAGCYYHLRRELTNREKLEVDRRRSNGERLGYILDDMRVLK